MGKTLLKYGENIAKIWGKYCENMGKILLKEEVVTVSALLSLVAAGDNTYCTDSLHHWLGCASCLLCLYQHYDKYVIGFGNSGRFMNNLSQLLI